MKQVIQNFKIILIVILVILTFSFYSNWKVEKEGNIRQTENISQMRKSDSLKYSNLTLNFKELREYLEYQNKELKEKLSDNGIKESRITKIIHTDFYYKDTTKNVIDTPKLIEAIKNNIPESVSWVDETNCLKIKGSVFYDGSKLGVTITDRELKNKTDVVTYWQRREWNLFGFKTRVLGKKEFTAKVFDNCGKTKFLVINKKED